MAGGFGTFRGACAGACIAAAVACGEPEAGLPAVRETLADGRVVVTYAAPATGDLPVLEPDLRIGTVSGAAAETFGDVRSFDVAADGTIYVLDGQAAEVRAFDATGAFLRTVATRGEGPGELTLRATGVAVAPDGTLWVDDFGPRVLLSLRPEGGEIARHPRISRSSTWGGTVAPDGVLWQPQRHLSYPDGRSDSGLQVARADLFYKSFDPRSGAQDSVLVTVGTERYFTARQPGTIMNLQPPFEPVDLVVRAADGAFWAVSSGAYRVVRMSAAGDTLVEIVVHAEGPPVTATERAEWLEARETFFTVAPSMRPEVEALVPERKPLLAGLAVDDEGRLWVHRLASDGGAGIVDVYLADGAHRASLRLPSGTLADPGPVIRGGRLYAVVADELEVEYVIRAPLPDVLVGIAPS